MEFELTKEQRAFAQSARDFALAEFAPPAVQWDAALTSGRQLASYCLTEPGAGSNEIMRVIVARELLEGCSDIR